MLPFSSMVNRYSLLFFLEAMRLGNSLWVIFNWDSYRSRVTGKEY